jgi:serine/threonine protein phosphatase PrpC
MVGDEEIVETIARRTSLDEATRELVRLANKAGGDDNITVVAFELVDEPAEETVERTVEQTQPFAFGDRGAARERPARRRRRFVPLILLLGVLVAGAVVLWVLTHR